MSDLDAWVDDGLVEALRRRRAVRAGATQAIAVTVGLVLGLGLPRLDAGPDADAGAVQALLVSLGGGLLGFIALVFSLLFLVVQHASTSFSPRLTLFRDDPLVWRAFAGYVGLLVFVATAGVVIGRSDEVSAVVPVTAVAAVVAALLVARRLQTNALRHVQLNATLHEVRDRGEAVIAKLYGRPRRRRDGGDERLPVVQEVRWERSSAILRQVDLPKLHHAAVDGDVLIRLHAGVGDELRRGSLVMTVEGRGARFAEDDLLDALDVGIDRTFEQDPLLAFRLLTDIGVRALSPAVNDPATAVAAIAVVQDLLTLVLRADLDVGAVHDRAGAVRVELRMPTWNDFLASGVDDLIDYGADVALTRRRLTELLDDLAVGAPPASATAIERRRRRLPVPATQPTVPELDPTWSTT